MALPTFHRFSTRKVYGQAANVSSTSTVSVPAPQRGIITEVGAMLSAAASTADATVTTSIAGTAITGGVITITQSGSAAGSTFTAIPTALRRVAENDEIRFAFSGSGTAGGPVTVWATIREQE